MIDSEASPQDDDASLADLIPDKNVPPQEEELHRKWFLHDFPNDPETGVPYADQQELIYRNFARNLVALINATPFWGKITQGLVTLDAQHELDTTYPLLSSSDAPKLITKPWDSLLLKAFRHNVRDNTKWPEPPKGGWILRKNWQTRVRDVVRCTIVVKYLDGVDLVAKLITDLARTDHLPVPDVSWEAREYGYYAAHVVVLIPLQLTTERWELITQEIPFEIQISTQAQDVIRKLTHKFYDKRRRKAKVPDRNWQWTPGCDEFVPNYLGHILHYVEGMVMAIRDREEGKTE